jgi:phospholipid/cholesterol/gamma-HCH transport system substrate-binding protein
MPNMNERTKQFRVGVLVFGTLLLASMLIMWNSDFESLPFQGKYQVKMLVDQAPGVAPGTPVRRRGIPIGRVAEVEDADDGALLTLDIDDGKVIKTNEVGRIRASMMGDAIIEFVPGAAKVGAQPIDAQKVVVKGQYDPSPMDLMANLQGDLKQTIVSLGEAGEEVAELADRVNQVMGENDMQRMRQLVDSMDRAMVEFATVTKNLNDIVGDEQFKAQLKDGLTQLPSLVADARAIMAGLEGAVGSADENLKNLQGLTGPLGNRGTVIVASLEQSIRNLEELLGQVALLTRNLNSSEGTVGLLMRDRQLYDQLNATIVQLQGTIGDARGIIGDPEVSRRVKQILYNAWVFSDKIARDPARLARGVVDRETPIK